MSALRRLLLSTQPQCTDLHEFMDLYSPLYNVEPLEKIADAYLDQYLQ